MKLLTISLLLLALAGSAISDSGALPCNTSSADHEVMPPTDLVLASFDDPEVAVGELERLSDPDNLRELSRLFNDALHAHIDANFYVGVTCGPCEYPDSCERQVRLLNYGTLDTSFLVVQQGGTFSVVARINTSLVLSLFCAECEFSYWG